VGEAFDARGEIRNVGAGGSHSRVV
jgi:hypothetical protein